MATNFTTQTRWAKAWSRLVMIGRDFFEKWQYFSLLLAIYNTAWWVGNYCSPLRGLQFWATRKLTLWTDAYMLRTYPEMIARLAQATPSTEQVSPEDYTIWVSWWQGEAAMPELVRGCYRQLCQHNTNVKLITKENFQIYCNIPDEILEHLRRGRISVTHCSDIIRVSILATHGGLWVDSTCWVSQTLPLEIYSYPFFSLRTKGLPTMPIWSNSRWASYCIGSNLQHNIVHTFLTEALCTVAKRGAWPFYLFMDYLYDLAYRTNPHVKAMFDAIPENNVQRGMLHVHLERAFDQATYDVLCQDTWVFKLSYKTPWRKTTAEGKPTFYGHLFTNAIAQ